MLLRRVSFSCYVILTHHLLQHVISDYYSVFSAPLTPNSSTSRIFTGLSWSMLKAALTADRTTPADIMAYSKDQRRRIFNAPIIRSFRAQRPRTESAPLPRSIPLHSPLYTSRRMHTWVCDVLQIRRKSSVPDASLTMEGFLER